MTSGSAIYEQESSFEVYGFAIVRNVLTPAEVREYRELFRRLFAKEGKNSWRMLPPREVYRHREIYALAFKPPVVERLRRALGPDLFYVPTFMLHRNMFGGWHTDSGHEAPGIHLKSKDYRFAKCGLFFQSNTTAWGGSIEVVPGGHKWLIETGNVELDFKLKQTINDHCSFYHKIVVDVGPGDFIFFDSRLPHASAMPVGVGYDDLLGAYGRMADMPEDNSKYVFYWDSGNEMSSKAFLGDALDRCLREKITEEAARFDYASRHYPEDYPPDLARMAEAAAVRVASLDQENSHRVKARLSETGVPHGRDVQSEN